MELKCGCYLFKVSFLPKLGDFWIQLFGINWLFTILEPEASSSLSPNTFSQHEVPVSSLCRAQKSAPKPPLSRQVLEEQSVPWIIHWGLQCANSEPHTAGSLAPHSSSHTRCWQLRSPLDTAHLSEFIFPLSYFTTHSTSRSDPTLRQYSAPASMSVRIRLSALPAACNTSHWTKAGCVASSRKVSPSFPSLPYGGVSLETLLWRLWRWRRSQRSAECRQKQPQRGLRNHWEQKSWRVIDERPQAATETFF